MKKIYKYEMPTGGGSTLMLPKGSKPLSVGLDPRGTICMWAIVDTTIGLPRIKYDFAAIGTGWPLEELSIDLEKYTFLGTVNDGLTYMWHYFYRVLEG